jgi:hypothetical protein
MVYHLQLVDRATPLHSEIMDRIRTGTMDRVHRRIAARNQSRHHMGMDQAHPHMEVRDRILRHMARDHLTETLEAPATGLAQVMVIRDTLAPTAVTVHNRIARVAQNQPR